jgi:two-component system, NarL family, sensor histidine kinase UhpB
VIDIKRPLIFKKYTKTIPMCALLKWQPLQPRMQSVLPIIIFLLLLSGAVYYFFGKANNSFLYGSIAVVAIVFVSFFWVKESADQSKVATHSYLEQDAYLIALNNINEALITINKEGHITYMNLSAEKLTGWHWQEARGQLLHKVFNVVNETTGNPTEHIAIAVLQGKSLPGWENNTLLKSKNNEVYVINNYASAILDIDGNITGAILLFNDTTGKHKIESELKQREKQFQELIQNFPEAMYTCDVDGTIKLYNKSAVDIWGKTPAPEKDQWCGAWKAFSTEGVSISPKDSPVAICVKNKHKVYGAESVIQRPDATFRNILNYAYPVFDADNTLTGAVNIGIDITERKKAETDIRTAIERYEILAHATSDTIWDYNIQDNSMLYNDGITKMFGYNISAVENVLEWWNDKLHPADINAVQKLLEDVFEKRLQRVQLTYRFRCANGSYKHIFDRAFVIFDETNKPVRMIGAMQDVTYQVEEEGRIAKAIIDAQEQERNHLGAELHDNINQMLVGTLLKLGLAKSQNSNTHKQNELLDSAITHITDVLSETRRLSHNLAPASFENHSLKDLFQNLLMNLNVDNRFKVNLRLDMKQLSIHPDIQINLYRILQEQIKNIIKYSEASNIEIELKHDGNNLRFKISDDGKGFDVNMNKKGIGLNNIKRRVELLSGHFIINSAPAKGCELIIEVPHTV